MNDSKVVTRFAPSPTGFMHVGGIRTALYAWAYARKHSGTFILRIEDTDKEREVAGSVLHIMESLRWLGITWDEGPEVGGAHAPYIQSERLALYKKYAERLIEKGYAYADPYTSDEVDAFRKEAEAQNRPFLFRNYRPENPAPWNGKRPLRFKAPAIKSYSWHDEVRGDLSAGEEAIDDFILIKSDGYPTYNFAHIIDDIEMGVTHVMRGEEFIASTPKFLSVYEALGITPPRFVTLPPILGEGGNKKLSKRDGAKDVLEYRTEGYLPSALINFLAFLGWNPGDEREVMSPEEFIAAFDIDRVGRSGAQWNTEKLDWLNKEHIKRMSAAEQETFARSFLSDSCKVLPDDLFSRLVPTIIERIQKGTDVTEMCSDGELDYFLSRPSIDVEQLVMQAGRHESRPKEDGFKAVTKEVLDEVVERLSALPEDMFDTERVKAALWDFSSDVGRGSVLWPLRYLLSGKDKSPDPFTIAAALGKEETLARIQAALLIL